MLLPPNTSGNALRRRARTGRGAACDRSGICRDRARVGAPARRTQRHGRGGRAAAGGLGQNPRPRSTAPSAHRRRGGSRLAADRGSRAADGAGDACGIRRSRTRRLRRKFRRSRMRRRRPKSARNWRRCRLRTRHRRTCYRRQRKISTPQHRRKTWTTIPRSRRLLQACCRRSRPSGRQTLRLVEPATTPAPAPAIERSADIIYLARGVRALARLHCRDERDRRGACALHCGRASSRLASPADPAAAVGGALAAAARLPARRRVAAGADRAGILLTVDPQNATITVRRIRRAPDSGRSYELWLISSKYPSRDRSAWSAPRNSPPGPLPASFDADAMRAASYAVSLEPAGGSPTGVPTGPILFTGKMVESVPGSPPSSKADAGRERRRKTIEIRARGG